MNCKGKTFFMTFLHRENHSLGESKDLWHLWGTWQVPPSSLLLAPTFPHVLWASTRAALSNGACCGVCCLKGHLKINWLSFPHLLQAKLLCFYSPSQPHLCCVRSPMQTCAFLGGCKCIVHVVVVIIARKGHSLRVAFLGF